MRMMRAAERPTILSALGCSKLPGTTWSASGTVIIARERLERLLWDALGRSSFVPPLPKGEGVRG